MMLTSFYDTSPSTSLLGVGWKSQRNEIRVISRKWVFRRRVWVLVGTTYNFEQKVCREEPYHIINLNDILCSGVLYHQILHW